MTKVFFSSDIIEFLFLLAKHKVNYLIVGGEAVIYYGHARLTGDIDIFFELERKNVSKLYKMLNEFWENDIPGISNEKELMKRGVVFQFGVPPNRIDLINEIQNVNFTEGWKNREAVTITHKRKQFSIYYIGLNELIKNKKAINRFRDREDLKFLNELKKKKKQ